MWRTLFEVFKRLFTVNDDLNRLQAESKRQGDQIREIVSNQTRFYYEYQLQRERDVIERERELHKRERALADHEQEKLRLENLLLRERLERLERLSLPPSTPRPADEPSED